MNELSREQVETTVSRFKSWHDCDGACDHDLRQVLDTDAALRQALAQQAQEVERLKKLEIELGDLRLRLNCPMVAPSCLVCGQVKPFAVKHLEASAIGVCEECWKAPQQLAAMTAERDEARAQSTGHSLMPLVTSLQAQLKGTNDAKEEILVMLTIADAGIKALHEEVADWRDRVAHLQATLAERERVIEQQEATIRGYRHSVEIVGRNHDDRKAERDTARQDAARLREALEALWRLTASHKITDLDAHAIIQRALKGEP